MQVLPNSTEPLGVSVMKARGLFPQAYWYWIGVGALVAYVFLFNIIFTLALTYLNRKHSIYFLVYAVYKTKVSSYIYSEY